jgi:hypothetical protein
MLSIKVSHSIVSYCFGLACVGDIFLLRLATCKCYHLFSKIQLKQLTLEPCSYIASQSTTTNTCHSMSIYHHLCRYCSCCRYSAVWRNRANESKRDSTRGRFCLSVSDRRRHYLRQGLCCNKSHGWLVLLVIAQWCTSHATSGLFMGWL